MSLLLNGLAASRGITIAPAYLLVEPDLSIKNKHTANKNHEVTRLHDSFTLARKELEKLYRQVSQRMGTRAGAVIKTQLGLLEDSTLQERVSERIAKKQETAEYALKKVVDHYLALFEHQNDNDYLYSRAMAMRDISQRVLSHLLQVHLPDPGLLTHRAVIVAQNVTPTDTARFDRRFVTGIVTANGGRTSHFTIMSKTLSLPAVVGVIDATQLIHTGDLLIVDGIHGKVIVNPSAEEVEHYQLLAGKFAREQQAWGALRNQQTVSKDGRQFELGANVGTIADLTSAQEDGAEGIGLLRTEFLYINRDHLPSEEEQFQAYKRFVTTMSQQRVIARTLDIGGDKKLGMFRLPPEDNPYLGFRAIRIGLARQEILRPQLRALLRASAYGRLAIMFPMISTVEEFRQARAILEEEQERLLKANIPVATNLEIGMMVEIPSVAVMADQFAQDVDFFSIGSNDLIQYLFAADRGNREVAYLYQELHPAVLRVIKHIIDVAHANGKWVGMCGEMAGNPLATPLLAGMGLDEFSMNSSQLLPIRALISHLDVGKLSSLVRQAMDVQTASEVERLVKKAVPSLI